MKHRTPALPGLLVVAVVASLVVALTAVFAPVSMAQALRGADAPPPSRVPVEPYFKHPDYSLLRISPSGKYVAGIVQVKGRGALAAINLETMAAAPIAGLDGDDINWFEWVNDDRLVFSAIDLQAGLGVQRGGGLYTVKRDGTEFRTLSPSVRTAAARGAARYRGMRFLAPIRDGGDDVLVVSNESNEKYPDVYRVNTSTGRKTLKTFEKPGDVLTWIADRKGAVRAAVAEDKNSITRVFWRPTEDGKWTQLGEYKITDPMIIPVGFDGDGSLIVASNVGRDTQALYRYDTDKKALGELLLSHPKADLSSGLVHDPVTQKIVGIRYDADRPGAAWFDENWARIQATLDKSLPGAANVFTRGSGPRVLVYSFSDTDPGTYYLLDLEKRRIEPLATARKSIKPDAMPTREPVRYVARDGLEIPGYLTLPKDREAKNLPLVMYVHGGPWVRGASWAWNDEPAFLAGLGYAVLEPEFRGSLTFGRKHFEASFKQWGRAMQDDLDDGMDWLVKRGIVDPKRVCIMGASYGGYAVMMGLARDPERWKCGINYVGVTDINLMFDVAWSDFADSNFIKYSAKEMIGDQVRDAAQLKATSPLEQAAKIKAPVLMAYGGLDFRVPLVHGEKMRDALRKHGVPVEWVVYPDEGHGFLREENRYDFYRRVAAFLDANLEMPPK